MELFRALGALAEAPSEDLAPIARSLNLGELPEVHEHTELFGMQLVPYASIYLGPEGHIGGEGRDRLKGFWRALDIEPPDEVDHLSVMLSSYAELLEMEVAASSRPPASVEDLSEVGRRIQTTFLLEHLAPWLPVSRSVAALTS